MSRPKKDTKIIKCCICGKKKRLHKSRKTCSSKCSSKYRNKNRYIKKS